MAIEAGDAIWRITGDNSGLNNALGASTKKIGMAMTAAGAVITGVFAKASFDAMTFGKAMANVATLGVRDLAGLDKGVRELSTTFGLDLNESAQALYDTISAGIPENAAIMVLEAAAKGAQAGVGTLSESMDLGTSIMNAWNLQGRDANETTANMERIMGQAATAIKSGKTTIQDMAVAVGQVAPVMAAGNVKTEEFFAALAALTATGQPTSSAMTALRQVIAGVIKPTSEASKLAQQLGIDFSIASIQSKGFAGFLQEIQEKTGGNVEQMGQLFGSVEALGAVISLTGNQAGKFSETLSQMGGAQQTLNEMSDAYIKNNPALAFEQLKAELTNLSIVLGRAVLPALSMMIDMISPIISLIGEWMEANPGWTAGIATVVAAIGGIMVVLGPILIALPGLIAAWGLLKAALASAGVAMVVLTGPVGIILGAIALLGAAMWYFVDDWNLVWVAIKDTVTKAAEFIVWILTPVFEMIGWILENLGVINRSDGYQTIGGRHGDRPVGLATGGTIQQGGWAMVGERGPELVQLPRGATVFDSQQTAAATGGTSLTVNFGRDSVRSDEDISMIERAISRIVTTKLQTAGVRI